MSFDIWRDQSTLAASIASLRPMKMGLRATQDELEANAEYIRMLCDLVGDHVERVMAEASASTSCTRIDEEDAWAISDLGSYLAEQLDRAADARRNERERGEAA